LVIFHPFAQKPPWTDVQQQISTGFASWLRYCTDIATEVNQTLDDVWPSPGLVHYIYIFMALAP